MYDNYARIRDAQGMKDSDVCKKTGISPGTMSDWKKGRYQLKADKLQKIADALGTTVDVILGGSAYYYDSDTAELAQEIFQNQDMRTLFDAARDSKPEDLRRAADLLRRFKETNPDG